MWIGSAAARPRLAHPSGHNEKAPGRSGALAPRRHRPRERDMEINTLREAFAHTTEQERLLAQGHERGWLTHTEIRDALAEAELDGEAVEEAIAEIVAAGIEIRDDEDEDDDAGYTAARVRLPEAPTSIDSLDLFLNAIGRTALLTKQDEIELAKRV